MIRVTRGRAAGLGMRTRIPSRVTDRLWADISTVESYVPWHKALAISRIMPKKFQELDMLTPEGLWVAYHLQLTRGPGTHHASGQTATL